METTNEFHWSDHRKNVKKLLYQTKKKLFKLHRQKFSNYNMNLINIVSSVTFENLISFALIFKNWKFFSIPIFFISFIIIFLKPAFFQWVLEKFQAKIYLHWNIIVEKILNSRKIIIIKINNIEHNCNLLLQFIKLRIIINFIKNYCY